MTPSLPTSAEVRELHPRQLIVLVMVADGLTDQEIAKRLCRSPLTVRNHVHAIMRRLSIRRRELLVRAAVRAGLVPA